MHGCTSERQKVMRELKVDNTPIIPMNQIYYSFIRPHSALGGATSAEAAGVGLVEGNKWSSLLNLSIQRKDAES